MSITLSLLRASFARYAVRAVMTVLSVALGVSFVVGVGTVSASLDRTFIDVIDAANADTDVYVRSEEGAIDDEGAAITPGAPLEFTDELAELPGVAAARPELTGRLPLLAEDETAIADGGVQTASADPLPAGTRIVRGELPSGDRDIAVDAQTAEDAGAEIGDQLVSRLAGEDTNWTLVGVIEAVSAAGTPTAVVGADTARELFAPEDRAFAFVVTASTGADLDKLVSAVAEIAPAGTEVITGAEKSAEEQELVRESLSFLTTFFAAFAAISLGVGAFIITNTFAMILAQRSTELALLRAIGAGRRHVAGLVLVEAVTIGAVGGLLGLAAGAGIGTLLASFVENSGVELAGIRLTSTLVAQGLGIAIAVTVAAALVPAIRGAMVSPLAAWRAPTDTADAPLTHRVVLAAALWFCAAGVAVLVVYDVAGDVVPLLGALAVFMIGGLLVIAAPLVRPVVGALTWPFTRRNLIANLARANVLRDPRRTAITAGALTVGLSLMSATAVISASASASLESALDGALAADVLVTGTDGPLDQATQDTARDVRGVDAATFLSPVTALAGNTPQVALAADPQALPQALNITITAGSLSEVSDDAVAISAEMATTRDLEVGDTIRLTLAGTEPTPLRISAIYDDQPVLAGAVVFDIDADVLAEPATEDEDEDEDEDENAPARAASSALITAAEGVTSDELATNLAEALADQGTFSIQTAAEFTESSTEPLRRALTLVSALLGLSVVIAVLGIVNTLFMSVYERTREIGLLRAIGLDDRQTWAMVLVESMATAIFGAVLGAAGGIALGALGRYALRDAGIDTLAVPWALLAVMVAGAALAGVIAAVLPALRAGRVNVLAAVAAT